MAIGSATRTPDGYDNLVGQIIDYEDGDMTDEEVVVFFGQLVKTGLAWSLQGTYGRMAASLIDAGYITRDGDITDKKVSDE